MRRNRKAQHPLLCNREHARQRLQDAGQRPGCESPACNDGDREPEAGPQLDQSAQADVARRASAVLLLFSFQAETDTGMKVHNCALVSVLWEYEEDRPSI
jgi:hypothetical protein